MSKCKPTKRAPTTPDSEHQALAFSDTEVRLIWHEIKNVRGWKRSTFFQKFREANPDFIGGTKSWNHKRLEKFLVLKSKGGRREAVPSEWRPCIARTFGWSPQGFQTYLKTGERPSETSSVSLKSMIEGHGAPEMIEARAILWRHLREQAGQLGMADIQEVLAECKMPPGLPVATGDLLELARSFRDNPSKLDPSQQHVWKLACQIYPWEEIEKSPIGMFGSEFDHARRRLAYFWNDSVKKAEVAGLDIVAEIARLIDAARHQVYILSWLELPLVLRTGDRGKGKVGLFKVGRWFQEHSA